MNTLAFVTKGTSETSVSSTVDATSAVTARVRANVSNATKDTLEKTAVCAWMASIGTHQVNVQIVSVMEMAIRKKAFARKIRANVCV